MRAAILLLALAASGSLDVIAISGTDRRRIQFGGEDGPLYLSPYVNKGKRADALRRSKVTWLQTHFAVEAHAGYITVSEEFGSNLFFLHMRAKVEHTKAPLILWLQGGPGESSLFGSFLENGPVAINKSGNLYVRTHTLQKLYNVVYLDQPVGAGYSFTRKTSGYSKSLEEVVEDIRKFLDRFLKLFPEYKGRQFYVAGEDFGARVAVMLAYDLHREKRKIKLNLRGVMCGVSFFGRVLPEGNVSGLYHQSGLLDVSGYNIAATNFRSSQQLLEARKYLQAFLLLRHNQKFLELYTGDEYDGNILQPLIPEEHRQFEKLMKSPQFKKSVHVGKNAVFGRRTINVTTFLFKDYSQDLSRHLETILDGGYKVLVYLGQLDPLICSADSEVFFRNLNWSGAEAFRKQPHNFWKVRESDDDFVGYVRTVKDFTYVLVKNAGHYPGLDRANVFCEMARKFMEEEVFCQPRNLTYLRQLLHDLEISEEGYDFSSAATPINRTDYDEEGETSEYEDEAEA